MTYKKAQKIERSFVPHLSAEELKSSNTSRENSLADLSSSAFGLEDTIARTQRKLARTPGQKRKAQKDKQRIRFLIDAPPALHELVEQLRKEEGVSKSRMVCFLAILGLHKLLEGEIDLSEYKGPSNTPLVDFTLHFPKIPEKARFATKFRGETDETASFPHQRYP